MLGVMKIVQETVEPNMEYIDQIGWHIELGCHI